MVIQHKRLSNVHLDIKVKQASNQLKIVLGSLKSAVQQMKKCQLGMDHQSKIIKLFTTKHQLINNKVEENPRDKVLKCISNKGHRVTNILNLKYKQMQVSVSQALSLLTQAMQLIKPRIQFKEARLSQNKEFKVKTELDTPHIHSSNRLFKQHQAYKSDLVLHHIDHPAVDSRKVIVQKKQLQATRSMIRN